MVVSWVKQNEQDIYEKIEKVRQQMISHANLLGLSHPKVLGYSKEIDDLYNAIIRKSSDDSSS